MREKNAFSFQKMQLFLEVKEKVPTIFLSVPVVKVSAAAFSLQPSMETV